jgi:hypothetical protein
MLTEICVNVGVASALVVVVKGFLKHLREERKSCDDCRAEHAKLLGNHIEHNTRALERLAESSTKQAEALKELSEQLR